MTGVSESEFAPEMPMNRAMIVTVLWRMEGSPLVNNTLTFEDVPANSWYVNAVKWAVESNVVSGYSSESFGSMDTVTREQVAAIFYRYSQYKGKVVTTTTEFDFSDANAISSWARGIDIY